MILLNENGTFIWLIGIIVILKETETDTVKTKLSDILMHVSWGDISREYFGKSGSWLYDKLNGIDGNKKPTEFCSIQHKITGMLNKKNPAD